MAVASEIAREGLSKGETERVSEKGAIRTRVGLGLGLQQRLCVH